MSTLCPLTSAALPIGAAFPDPAERPCAIEYAGLLSQRSYREVRTLESWLDKTHPNLRREWKYSRTAGWYVVPLLKKRRLYYLLPQPNDFRLNIILGNHALISLAEGTFASRLADALQSAKHYPEGTALAFDAHSLTADFGIALVTAKIAH